MSSGNTCSVINCTYSGVKIQIWKKSECEIHKPLLCEECPCLLPYSLHRFPGRAEDQEVRQTWVKNINRKNFVPNHNSRVCGVHFPDGRPTKAHPYPVLHMGYEHKGTVSTARAPPKRRCLQPLAVNSCATEPAEIEVDHNNQENMPPQKCDVGVQWPDVTDHSYSSKKSTKDSATQTDPAPSFSAYDLDDRDCKFFTGIGIRCFWQLLCAITVLLPQPKSFKLALHDQLLLVLMRLRLSLMFTDLGKRFGISRSTACEIFAIWRSILARFMNEKIIAWLPRDTLQRIRPQSFCINYPKATCIIDCTEIFVQRPKNYMKRSQTYSNYKSHNTYKALYCIAPNGYVMFVSKLFGGRASDTFITKNSGLIGNLLPGDQVLADRGFTITDFLPPGVTLAMPAFTRGSKELPEHEVTRTRRLANVRIHVERSIRRLKVFKILSNVIPGRIQHVDDIVAICAGLCNLQPQLIREEIDGEEALEMDGHEDIDDDEHDVYAWDMAEDIED